MRDETRAQWRTLLSVDDAIKRFFSAMRDTGELENTIVIYVSDNGYSLGSHRNPWKDCPYEECIHVPLLIRWPGRTTVPEVTALTGAVDVAPTVAEMADASPSPRPDGTSLVPLLTGRVLESSPTGAAATRPLSADRAELLGNPNPEVDVRPL